MYSHKLHFFYAIGCGACAEAEPVLHEFMRGADQGDISRWQDISLLKHNAGTPGGARYKIPGSNQLFVPRATPSYLVIDDDGEVRTSEGALDLEELKRFVFNAAPPKKPRKPRAPRTKKAEAEAEDESASGEDDLKDDSASDEEE